MKFILGYSEYDWVELCQMKPLQSSIWGYQELMDAVIYAEEDGWRVEFETSFLRRLFKIFKYRVIAIKR